MNDIKQDIKKRHKNLTEFRYIAVGFFLIILSTIFLTHKS